MNRPPTVRRAAFILFTEPYLFPPTLHAAAVLVAKEWQVDIIGLRIETIPQWKVPDGVRVIYLDKVRTRLALRAQYALFIARCAWQAWRLGYQTVIGYDIMAALPAYVAAQVCSGVLLYHNHDLMPLGTMKGLFYKAAKRAEMAVAHRADAVVFPQRERAEVFAREANLKKPPLIVHNCPMKNWGWNARTEVPPESFIEWKRKIGHVVLYQGGLVTHRGLFELVESIKNWTFRGGLCLVGLPLEKDIVRRLSQRAAEWKVEDRLLILDPMPHDCLAAVTFSADAGIGVVRAGDCFEDAKRFVNLRWLAGASNKVFEYMAAGIPVVCPRSAGFSELIDEPRHGVLFEEPTPQSIAGALNRLFADESLRKAIGVCNREAFLSTYNYEAQFQKVLDLIESKCARVTHS